MCKKYPKECLTPRYNNKSKRKSKLKEIAKECNIKFIVVQDTNLLKVESKSFTIAIDVSHHTLILSLD